MFNELKLYCKSEGLSEYLRSEARISSDKNGARGKEKAQQSDNNDKGSIKKAG